MSDTSLNTTVSAGGWLDSQEKKVLFARQITLNCVDPSSKAEVFNDLDLPIYESNKLVTRTTKQQEPDMEVIAHSLLKTTDGFMFE